MSDLYQRDGASVAALSRLRFYPLAASSGSGCWLTESDGRRILDATGGLGAAGLGFAHPAVVEAVSKAVATMPGVSVLSGTHPYVVDLAERLCGLLPGDHRVYLGHAGTDANTAAIRYARAATGRRKVLTFSGSYHGGLGESQALSDLYVSQGVPADPGLVSIGYPHPYGDPRPDLLERTLSQVQAELAGGDVALLLVEPVSNDGGLLVPPDGFLTGLRELCSEHSTLFGGDEVKVGLGRTGHLKAHQAEPDAIPDILTLGKTLGGGLPLSAAILPAAAADIAVGELLLTTAGNAVSTAAGLAVLDVIISERLWENAARIGDRLQQQLTDLAKSHPLIGDVRGRGLTIGVELIMEDRAPATTACALTTFRAYELGLAVDYVGPDSNIIELTPPLIMTEEEADTLVEILAAALTDVEAGRVPVEAIAEFTGW